MDGLVVGWMDGWIGLTDGWMCRVIRMAEWICGWFCYGFGWMINN